MSKKGSLNLRYTGYGASIVKMRTASFNSSSVRPAMAICATSHVFATRMLWRTEGVRPGRRGRISSSDCATVKSGT